MRFQSICKKFEPFNCATIQSISQSRLSIKRKRKFVVFTKSDQFQREILKSGPSFSVKAQIMYYNINVNLCCLFLLVQSQIFCGFEGGGCRKGVFQDLWGPPKYGHIMRTGQTLTYKEVERGINGKNRVKTGKEW